MATAACFSETVYGVSRLHGSVPGSHGSASRSSLKRLSCGSPSLNLLSSFCQKLGRKSSAQHGNTHRSRVSMVSTPTRPTDMEIPDLPSSVFDPGAKPPFSLSDIRAAIPKHCWEKNTWKSMSYLLRDVAIVFGMAAGAAYLNSWYTWPLYWFAQGTMFWALFVVGHDCGHGSFSNSKKLNDLIGHLTHASILVPYHGWRISHRTHHANHGHVENDESWHPLSKSLYDKLEAPARAGRLTIPWALLAYPFYLWSRSPGKKGSHYDPQSDLFVPNEKNDVLTSTRCWWGMLALLAGLTTQLGPLMMFNLYFMPYWLNVIWLDVVTYLHHHGYDAKVPWYRGEEWNYMRGGLSTIDRDYGIFNNIHHDIGTHVVHHLFPQIPHYNLVEATEAVKPVLGDYYREPEKASGPFPFHLLRPLLKSFSEDHYVADEGEVVYYQKDPNFR